MNQETIQGYRLSPQQKHLWLLQQDGRVPDRISCVVKVEGELDTGLLKQALDHAVAQHEILRTTFQLLSGMTIPVQVIAEEQVISLETHNLTALAAGAQSTQLDQIFLAATRRQHNYAQLPLFAADLVEQSASTHQLVLTAPALCADGPSLQILVRQIAGAYAELERGEEPVTTGATQYADFAEWQNELLESEDGAAGRQYWKRFDLSQAFARRMSFEKLGAAECFQPDAMTVKISSEAAKNIEAVAARNSLPASSFYLACWQTLLSRSTGWEAPLVGVTFDGRKFDELHDAIGLLSSSLPRQSDLRDSPRFIDLWRQVADSQREAQQWQEYFSRGLSEGDEETGHCIPHCFEWRTRPADFAAGSLTFSFQRQDVTVGDFKLKLVCEQRSAGIETELQYDANAFSSEAVMRLAGRLETLIAAASDGPESAVADLEILSKAERHLLLVDFNDNARDFEAEHERETQCNHEDNHRYNQGGIHKLFEAQVAKNPNGIALVFEAEQLTYAQLNARANQLAHHLRKLGVGPDVPVALGLDRSIDLIVGLLGILKAGGAYVPLDPGLPPARLELMLSDAGARVLVTRSEMAAALGSHLDQVVSIDTDRALLTKESTDDPEARVSDQNLVYIIFTSGSTGRPKGVAVEHRQLLNYLNSIWEKLALPAGSSFATVSTVAADLGNTVLFPPLCKGGTLHLISEERATNPDALAEYCRRHPIDCLKIVPSHLSALLSAASPADVLPRRRLVLGGEASSWSLIEKIKSLAPHCEILNHYGPTEATVGAVSYDVDVNAPRPGDTVPLGRPLANTQVFILDEAMRLAPIGAPGELHIGGSGVARGYINHASATAEKFIPDPFGGNGTRLYRTGDGARYLPDGRIEFLGRVDDQVKIHGFRIEPREIELALCDHPKVETTVVVAREDLPGEKRLVAYCVGKEHHVLEAGELRTFLRGKLPEYMLPSAFVFLKQLPLTPNGKTDRQALPAPDPFRSEGDGAFAAPRNQVEETLAGLWTSVLGVERVGINDNFFELGGDSILSIQIIARANQAGLRLSPRQLFQHQTIAELASVAGTSALVAADQGSVTGVVPLTPVQARFFEQDQPAPHYYNQAMLLRVDESIDAEVLERATRRLLLQHDALRLRFSRTGRGWQQWLPPADDSVLFETPFVVIDLSHLSDPEQQIEFQRRAASLQGSLNLQNGPLVRVAFFNQGKQGPRYLLIVIHHLATDGVSWSVLLEDLQTLCKQLSAGEKVALPPKTTSFKSWAERLHAHSQSEVLLAEAPHWLSLSANTGGHLPKDYEGGANTAASARTVSVALEADETRALLQEVPAAFRTQINEVLLTALTRAVGDWTGSRRLLLDLEGHGREDVFEGVDLSRTVGWFTTIFPVLLDASASQTPIEALRLVKEQLRSIPGRGLGYGLLRYASGNEEIAASLRAQPQAEVRFNYLGQLDRALPESRLFKPAAEPGDPSSGPLQSPLNARGYLLNIIGSIVRGQLRLEWTYSENVHRRETVEKLAASYVAELRALIEHSRKAGTESFSPSDFPSAKLSQEDLSKVLAKLQSRER